MVLGSTSQLFRAGHRIRLQIASSNFPRFDRNPQQVIPVHTASPADLRVARQTVFHDAARPSRLVLPVVEPYGGHRPDRVTRVDSPRWSPLSSRRKAAVQSDRPAFQGQDVEGADMKGRLLRRLAAATLAVTIIAPVTTQPAHAGYPGDVTLPPPGPVVKLGLAAWKLYKGNLTANDIEAILTAAIGASTAARDQVLSRIDAHVAARALGEADALTIRFDNYRVLRDTWEVYFFASDAITAASVDSRELVATIDNREAADAIGHALNIAYSMALTAMKDAGYTQATQDTMLRNEIASLELIVDRLEPTCTSTIADTPGHISEVHYTCTAANGETASNYQIRNVVTGEWIRPAVNVDQLKVEAAINSSWVIALELLPTLKSP